MKCISILQIRKLKIGEMKYPVPHSKWQNQDSNQGPKPVLCSTMLPLQATLETIIT